MRKFFKAFVRDERGVSALEYAMMAGIVAVTLGAVGLTFKTTIATLFTNMTTAVSTASTS
ncbi:Flp/Fap pilin component (plasmid) [Caballeronia sp. SBC1]|uniref:Flp family type IVb pilin n=1 Tax=unclassified Caballeronia TaxID=2646786 RepID=UPI0013E145CE|nr:MULTISPECIES: Flp family type IVb pilin [unclassified Caballeronia]QIE29910.1 Flp/Fap pilin component [Caballeronia sp. SBC2]QIN67621.1 Flp/Fap pilin component [Caballeronia sp. SBC1]